MKDDLQLCEDRRNLWCSILSVRNSILSLGPRWWVRRVVTATQRQRDQCGEGHMMRAVLCTDNLQETNTYLTSCHFTACWYFLMAKPIQKPGAKWSHPCDSCVPPFQGTEKNEKCWRVHLERWQAVITSDEECKHHTTESTSWHLSGS